MADTIAGLFRTLRLKSAVYFAQDFSPPWGMRLPSRPHAQFHVALAGGCAVEMENRSLTMKPHDVVLFPTGAPHAVLDGLGGSARDGREIVQAIRSGGEPFAGPKPSVRLLSGHFEFDRDARHPLVMSLPEIIHVSSEGGLNAVLFENLYPLLSIEAAAQRPGAETIVERLAEIFLVQILRTHFGGAGAPAGLMAAMFDSRLSAAIALMHQRWKDPLTVLDMAQAAGMSRSAFAAAFKTTTQISPMSYLSRWRLLKGREMLSDSRVSVARIAEACGHESTEGFSRAFKRVYGMSPKDMRRAVLREPQ